MQSATFNIIGILEQQRGNIESKSGHHIIKLRSDQCIGTHPSIDYGPCQW